MDQSSGYEAIASDFLPRRGKNRSTGIGVREVSAWARRLPRGSNVLDLGCGPGFPLTSVLVDEELNVYGVDGAPSFVDAFRRNLPGIPILCDAVQTSKFFNRTFDAVLAWGLMFLLKVEDQQHLVQRFAELLAPKGRLLFTSPAQHAVWTDAMTGMESVSLGAEEYRKLLHAEHFSVESEYEDEGENHYFDAFKDG
jgi:SAM-dependent methyltransferase